MAEPTRGFGYWAPIAVGVIIAMCGLPILAVGISMIVSGGSWHYALIGLGLLISAYYLFQHAMLGVWAYSATFMGTLIWALSDAGFNAWANVPRLIAPTIILFLVLATIPALRGRLSFSRDVFAAASVGVVTLGLSLVVLTSGPNQTLFAEEASMPVSAPAIVIPEASLQPAHQPVRTPISYGTSRTEFMHTQIGDYFIAYALPGGTQ